MRRAVIAGLVVILALVGGAVFAYPRLTQHASVQAPYSGIQPDVDGGPAATAVPTAKTAPTAKPAPTARSQQRRPVVVASRSKASSTATNLVLIVLDGGQPQYLDAPNTPHLQALVHSGTRYTNAFAGILESETPSGHASIGTGSVPKQDGILSFDWASGDNLSVDLFDPNKIRDGSMERIMQSAGAPSIAGLIHAKSKTDKVVALSGHKYYAADAIGGPRADVIMYYTGTPNGKFVPTFVPGHGPPQGVLSTPGLVTSSHGLPMGVEDHLAMKLATLTFQRLHQRATLINLPEFDWPLGHVDGASRDPKDVAALMQDFDRDLGDLENVYRKAGVLDNTLFVITADHGFAPIYHTVDHDQIDNAIKASGAKVISDSYHTAVYAWLNDESKAAQAAENVAKLQNPYVQSVYFKEPLANGGYDFVRASGAGLFKAPGTEAANQYLLNSFTGPNAPDVVVFFTEEAASLPGGESSWKGDHGGADWESQHFTLLFSGPGVRHGVTSTQPARLEDIAPTALTLMGIAPTGMGGIVLADALQHPTAAQVATEASYRQKLQPVVQALQAEAAAEVKAGL